MRATLNKLSTRDHVLALVTISGLYSLSLVCVAVMLWDYWG